MDEPTAQLQSDLRDSVTRALRTRRPILTHLNADTSWLLQLPCHSETVGGRSFFNLLLDPWFRGPQIDVAAWFSKQWHATDSSVQTIEELDELLEDVQGLAQERDSTPKRRRHSEDGAKRETSYIDAVLISHEFTDHCNKDTLLEVRPSTPVFATKVAADLIRSWKHFSHVREIRPFLRQDFDWRNTSYDTLPNWLGISRIVTGTDALYFHSAILITFDLNARSFYDRALETAIAEAVIYTPHGIYAQDLGRLTYARPRIRTLALLHGLDNISLGRVKQLNLGAYNGLEARRVLEAGYWIPTHDEVKKGEGVVASFLRRKVLTIQAAMAHETHESQEKGSSIEEDTSTCGKEVNFAELRNGESLLLT